MYKLRRFKEYFNRVIIIRKKITGKWGIVKRVTVVKEKARWSSTTTIREPVCKFQHQRTTNLNRIPNM